MLITADEAYRAMYGFSSDEALDYANWEARLHSDDREPLKRQVEECLNAGSQWLEEFRIIHPKLGTRWLAGLGRDFRDAEGQVSGMTGINIDVTDTQDGRGGRQRKRGSGHKRRNDS